MIPNEMHMLPSDPSPSCPQCGSFTVQRVIETLGDRIQYTCLDCGYRWDRLRGLHCPQCHAFAMLPDGAGYRCERCGHTRTPRRSPPFAPRCARCGAPKQRMRSYPSGKMYYVCTTCLAGRADLEHMPDPDRTAPPDWWTRVAWDFGEK